METQLERCPRLSLHTRTLFSISGALRSRRGQAYCSARCTLVRKTSSACRGLHGKCMKLGNRSSDLLCLPSFSCPPSARATLPDPPLCRVHLGSPWIRRGLRSDRRGRYVLLHAQPFECSSKHFVFHTRGPHRFEKGSDAKVGQLSG